jgi:quercetin dioxygenase-like cupin family protein
MQAFGDYKVIAHHEFPECSLRLLRVEPGQEIPVHYHAASSQSYLVIEGAVEVRVGEVWRRLDHGGAVRVPAGELHAVRPVDRAALVLSASVPPLRRDDHFPAGGTAATLS